MILYFNCAKQNDKRVEQINIYRTMIWSETSCFGLMMSGFMVSALSNSHVIHTESSEKQQKREPPMPQKRVIIFMLSAFLIFKLLNRGTYNSQKRNQFNVSLNLKEYYFVNDNNMIWLILNSVFFYVHQDHTSQDHFCSVIDEFPV